MPSKTKLPSDNNNPDCLLHLAVIEEEDTEVMEFLLMHGVPVDGRVSIGELGLTPSELDISEENKSNNDHKITALDLAARQGESKKAALLLRHGAEPRSEVLLAAASRGRGEIVELLLEHGADPDAALSSSGRRGLHCAVLLRDEFLTLALLRRGADPNASDYEEVTPLHLAAEAGFEELARLLLQFDASCEVKTRKGATPLHLALAMGHKNVVALLIGNGARIESVIKDDDGSLDLDLFPWLSEDEIKDRRCIIDEHRVPSQGQKWYDGILRILNKQQSTFEGAKKACAIIDDL